MYSSLIEIGDVYENKRSSTRKNFTAQLCNEHNTNIHALARCSGISPSTLKSIIYGSSLNPGIVTIKIICDGLGISLIDFLDCELFQNLEQEIE